MRPTSGAHLDMSTRPGFARASTPKSALVYEGWDGEYD